MRFFDNAILSDQSCDMRSIGFVNFDDPAVGFRKPPHGGSWADYAIRFYPVTQEDLDNNNYKPHEIGGPAWGKVSLTFPPVRRAFLHHFQ